MQRKLTVAALLCLLTGCALLFTGCQGTVATSPALPPLSASEMVGKWVGTAENTGGSASGPLYVVLKADGTLYCKAFWSPTGSGTWSVSGSSYTDTQRYAGVSVSSSGTVSGNTISGKWFATNGMAGEFELTKQ